jgi:hypothetical protein
MIASARVTVSNGRPTLLLECGSASWTSILVENVGKSAAFLGAPDVTADTGKRLAPGQVLSLLLPPSAALYAVTAKGSTDVDLLRLWAA